MHWTWTPQIINNEFIFFLSLNVLYLLFNSLCQNISLLNLIHALEQNIWIDFFIKAFIFNALTIKIFRSFRKYVCYAFNLYNRVFLIFDWAPIVWLLLLDYALTFLRSQVQIIRNLQGRKVFSALSFAEFLKLILKVNFCFLPLR